MSAENQDQDFEMLQRLLKLKRHEQPPPRFFNDFSGQVTARIRAGTVGGKLASFDDVVAQTPWLQRFWLAIEGKPAVSGMFAAGVCGLLVAGILLGDQTQNTIPSFAEAQAVEAGGNQSLLAATPVPEATGLFSSTKPAAVLPGSSLFNAPVGIVTPVIASGMPLRLGTNGF